MIIFFADGTFAVMRIDASTFSNETFYSQLIHKIR